MESVIPRVVLAGTNSGCGKTTVSCAILQSLVNRGLKVGACKCGPDYIDPMFHSRIIGAKSSNLDLHFFSENTLRFLLAKNAADRDVSIMEGVMGFYDGMGLTSTRASTYEVAKATQSPVILVVNAKGGGAGRLFGSVTNQEIADALKAKTGINIDKRKIVIADPIKNVGTYTVTCKLGYEITAPLTVKIEEGK